MGSLGIIAVLVFAIPVVAVIGGITAGIMKTRGQQRLIELAQRERIAAIEKGIDPAKLPLLPVIGSDDAARHLRTHAKVVDEHLRKMWDDVGLPADLALVAVGGPALVAGRMDGVHGRKRYVGHGVISPWSGPRG